MGCNPLHGTGWRDFGKVVIPSCVRAEDIPEMRSVMYRKERDWNNRK